MQVIIVRESFADSPEKAIALSGTTTPQDTLTAHYPGLYNYRTYGAFTAPHGDTSEPIEYYFDILGVDT